MLEINLSELEKNCSCNKAHKLYVKEITIKKNALKDLPDLVHKYGYTHPIILCDDHTYKAAGEQVQQLLPEAECIQLNSDGLHADEHGVEAAEKELNDHCDLLIAVGSGTIHDITRYLAYHKNLTFYSVPTAASVDGFVSTVAAMTWKGFKKSFTAVSPLCVIADTNIYSKAPNRLTASGVADLLGKYTALVDWRISHLITGENICEEICKMEEKALQTVKENLEGLAKGDSFAFENLMYGLLLSGLAMQMVENSRPASGAEHHLSHLWEMEILNERIEAYHGEKVGVGLCIACDRYQEAAEKIRRNEYIIHPSKETLLDFKWHTERELELRKEMEEENTPNPLAEVDLGIFEKKQSGIAAILETLPTGQTIRNMLKLVDAPTSLEEINLSPDILDMSCSLSPYVRRRITFMRLLKLYE